MDVEAKLDPDLIVRDGQKCHRNGSCGTNRVNIFKCRRGLKHGRWIIRVWRATTTCINCSSIATERRKRRVNLPQN